MKITDRAMQASPTSTDQWLIESFGRGHGALIGRITPAGTRSFYFRYAGTNGQVRLLIGPFGSKGDGVQSFTVALARNQALQWAALYRSGIKDLREHLELESTLRQQQQADDIRAREEARLAAEREHQQRLTVKGLFDRWRDTELVQRMRPDGSYMGRKDSGQLVLDQFARHLFPLIGERTAKEVTKSDVLRVIDIQLSAGKQRTAAMLFSDLHQMFKFALDRELIPLDPMATLNKSRIVGAPVERDRILSPEEIRLLAAALPSARMSPRSICAVWLILATGCRIGEAMGATWSDDKTSRATLATMADNAEVKLGYVDLKARTWHLPDTKNGRSHTIHLSTFALRQFSVLRDIRETAPWVFPNSAGTGPVCVKSFAKQLSDRQRTEEKRLNQRSKAVDSLNLPGGRWTPHDLRRTAASLMAAIGIGGDVIDECLNHVIESKMRRVYIRDRREAEQIKAFDALGEHLDKTIEANVACP